MVKKNFIANIIFIYSLVVLNQAVAQAQGPGTTSAAFLKIDPGARTAALGGAFGAIADDTTAIQFNPAGTAQLPYKELFLSQTFWFQSINNAFIGYVHPLKNHPFSLGVNLNYLYMADLTKRDITGNDTGEKFEAYGSAATFNISSRMLTPLYLGLNAKIVTEKAYIHSARAKAIDAGILYKTRLVSFGIAAQNIGTSMKLYETSFSLPANYKYGLGIYPLRNLVIGIDINQPLDNKLSYHTGLEYRLFNALALRAGYTSQKTANTGTGLSGGLGIRDPNWPALQIDYAYVSYGDLGLTHRISLKVSFGMARKESKRPEDEERKEDDEWLMKNRYRQ